MRKVHIFSVSLIILLIMAALSGCTKEKVEQVQEKSEEKFTVVTSFYPMYIFTKNIAEGAENVEVINMTEPQTGCLHDYQLSVDDMKVLERADVLVINGSGMESFMDKVASEQKDLKIVEASQGIELIKNEHEEGGNPHVWVGISGAITEVKNIANGLSEIDPNNAKIYIANADKYVGELEALREKMIGEISKLPNKNIVTFHEAFPYFSKEFNLNVVGVIEKEPGQEPSAEELGEIIEIVKKNNVKALFTEEQYSPKAAETIANETGAKVYQLDLVVTGEKDADPNSYILAMEKNLEILIEALK